MALSTRGKAVVGVSAIVVLLAAAALGYVLLTGGEGPLGIIGGGGRPRTCPLTGLEADGNAPDRPALAVKIENISVARPQIGLQSADIVFEEPVEGGITRFVVVFQCQNAPRIGPIRSARVVDADILRQFGTPIFAYAGGAEFVVRAVEDAGVVNLHYQLAPQAYERDPAKEAPHDLYSTTRALYRAAEGGTFPDPIFTYEEDPPQGAARARRIHADFSPESDVRWRFNRQQGVWLRFHGSDPHTLEDGSQVSATNVVVKVVETRLTSQLDPAGNPVPEVDVTGRGPAFVFRDGRVIEGRWIRQRGDDPLELVDEQGNEIALAPGTTWVELFPRELFDQGQLEF